MNISVIITTHRDLDHHLQRCVDSVKWQLQPGDELILVADGYCPSGPAVENLQVSFQPKSGVAAARNYGAHQAVNPWLKFLDVDDLLAPFALNAVRTIPEDKIPADVAVIVGGMFVVQDGLAAGYRPPADIEGIMDRVNPCLVSQCFLRRSVFNLLGIATKHGTGFDERIEFEEDWEFWLRLRAHGLRLARVDSPVCYYWINAAERAAKVRNHQVEGQDIRDYLKATYGVTP